MHPPAPVAPPTPLRSRSFLLLLVCTLGGFTGYVLLLPIVAMWAVRGGAGELAAGAVNGTFMLVTVLTQLGMPWLLARIEHRTALGLGVLLIGLPAPLYAATAQLPGLLAISGVRGIGFGLLTVAGSALVAELVPPAVRGRAAGLYGLAVGLPNVAFLPAGVWLAQHIGFQALFWTAGLVPAATAAMAFGIARTTSRGPRASGRFPRALLSPWATMTAGALAAGGLVAFLPLAVGSGTSSVALLAFGATTLLGRWLAGQIGDRAGRRQVLVPSVLLAGLGAALVAVGAGDESALAVPGAALLGAGFGAMQNVTLVAMFDTTSSGTASTAWNIAYDGGNGLGSVGFGMLITLSGYPTAFAAAATLILLCIPLASRSR
ncbi:MFS transporter [Saccharopolyspora sp. HNM0983]|uniref:MFS transporter n=1 Tax=Saccharopolyspora montiporae TaxID=2781240 RepID=A0A929G2H0_9PSEU|nr:MFS transporter [Saccharopolyspora sp. HNM0983]MBE9375788.1 MFS transporter [Saccharopolyspora sp. HNM0983]